jgi:cytochrome P450 family 110
MAENLPPGPRIPKLAQTALWLRNPLWFLERSFARHGEPFTLRLAGFPAMVFISSPELVRKIFTADPAELHGGENTILLPLLGRHSTLLLDGAEHLRRRRLLLPPFHGERVASYLDVMREATHSSIDQWPIATKFSLRPSMQQVTMEIILRTIFGIDHGPRVKSLAKLLGDLIDLAASPVSVIPALQRDWGTWSPWGRFLRKRKQCDDAIYDLIAALRRSRTAGRKDVLSLLLDARDEDGQAMTDVELRDELVTFIAAGHETSATTLCWAFERILSVEGVLTKLVDELTTTVGIGNDVTGDDLPKLTYLDAFIKETLRFRPMVPNMTRTVKVPFELGGYVLPVGTVAVACQHLTHRQSDLFPEPDRFIPERFFSFKADPYNYYPFGGGTRRCIGINFAVYELKVILATILSRVRMRLAPGYRPRTIRRVVILAPSEGTLAVVDERRTRAARAA